MEDNNLSDDYTINEVFDFVTGKYIKTEDIFKKFDDFSEDEKLLKKAELRSKLEDARKGYTKQAIYGCWYCHALVILRAINKRNKRKQHFKAEHSKECKIKSLNSLSHEQILRIKFNGQQEGYEHIRLKNIIADLLQLNKDNKHEVKDIIVDKRRHLSTDEQSKEWRKPDIFTTLHINDKPLNLAIELQLATTFIEVVKERQHFYKRDNSYVIWVFKDFSTNIDELKMMFIDVFVANTKNAFIINQETIIESEKRGELVLSCYYRKYTRVGLEISCDWGNDLITLSELTYTDDFRVFFHDADGEYAALQGEKEEIEMQMKEIENAKFDESKLQHEIPQSVIDQHEFSQKDYIIQVQIIEEAENKKIEEIVDKIKKIYKNTSDNSFSIYLINKEINDLSENSVRKLNNKFRFNSDNKVFIQKLIFEDSQNSHNDFLHFVLKNKNIALDLDITKDGITAFQKIIEDAQLYQIHEIISCFYRNNYTIKHTDRAFLEKKFPCQDVTDENFCKYYLINLMSKLNSCDLITMLSRNKPPLIIWALLSIKYDHFIYWDHKNYRASANLVLSKYSEFGDIYIQCLLYYNKLDQMFKEDKSGNFKKIYNDFLNNKPEQDFEHSELLKLVIPELFN